MPATREERPGKGQGRLGSRHGAPTRDPPSLRFPNASTRQLQSGEPQVEAISKRSLGCPVHPLPCFPKMPIILVTSCPMAHPEPGRSRTRRPWWPWGPGSSPGAWSPAPAGGSGGVCEVTEASRVSSGPGNSLGRWPLTRAVDLVVTTNYVSRAPAVQGK